MKFNQMMIGVSPLILNAVGLLTGCANMDMLFDKFAQNGYSSAPAGRVLKKILTAEGVPQKLSGKRTSRR